MSILCFRRRNVKEISKKQVRAYLSSNDNYFCTFLCIGRLINRTATAKVETATIAPLKASVAENPTACANAPVDTDPIAVAPHVNWFILITRPLYSSAVSVWTSVVFMVPNITRNAPITPTVIRAPLSKEICESVISAIP